MAETEKQVGGYLEHSSEMVVPACMVLILLGDGALEVGVGKTGSKIVVAAFVVSTVVIGTVVLVEVAEIEAGAETVMGAVLAGVLVEGSKKVLVVKMGGKEVGFESG